VVRLLVDMGYVSLDVQYIDGTKIESYTFVWKKSVENRKAKLESKIKGILSDIESAIASDNQALNKEELPEKIDSAALKEKLSELNKKLKASDKEQQKELAKLQTEHLPKLEAYENQLNTLGERNSYSKTDPDYAPQRRPHAKWSAPTGVQCAGIY
jgi:flagellar motility protein MotE (MotC chaperone)